MSQNELFLTDIEKKLGITKIERLGSLKSGFVIEFTINGSILRLPTGNTISTTYLRLNKRLAKFQLPENEIKDLHGGLETIILNNFDWMTGKDVKNEKEGYIVNSENTLVETTTQDETDDNDLSTFTPVSIPQAIGMHSGRIQFEGVIASAATDKFQFLEKACWRCYDCQSLIPKTIFNILDIPNTPKECPHCESNVGFEHLHTYINSRHLKIQSEDNTNDTALELLPVYVLNEYTDNIQLSGRVKIYGKIAKRQDPRTKQFFTVIITNFVEYKDKKKLILTKQDKAEIIRYSKRKTLERDLIDQFAKNIIGEDFAKLTVLLCAIGAPELLHPVTGRVIKRGRMHILIIGPPGCGKTVIAKEGGDLRVNSKFVSGTNTTGGSLTSMILSEDGKLTLRLGVAATTLEAFLIINEFDKLPDEHKNAILEVMEEGESILNKYAFLRKINAQTSIIATANPVNGDWLNPFMIQNEEIPFPLQLLSRFDAVLIFRRNKTREACEEFAEARSKLTDLDFISDYGFLQKFVECARGIKNIRIESNAKTLLNGYYSMLMANDKIAYDVSNRTYETIYRYALTFARLYLSNVVTKSIAQRAIDHIEEMLSKLNLSSFSQVDPFIHSYNKVMEYLQLKTNSRSNAVILVNAIKKISLRDEIVSDYIGDIFERRLNFRLNKLCDKILERTKQTCVEIVKSKPTIVYWKHNKYCNCPKCAERGCDQCDQCDPKKSTSKRKKSFPTLNA